MTDTYRRSPQTIAKMCICVVYTDLLQYNMSCILVRRHITENDTVKMGSDQK